MIIIFDERVKQALAPLAKLPEDGSLTLVDTISRRHFSF
jgi:hypothetical protein